MTPTFELSPRIDSKRYETLVFPIVPTMPTSFRFSLGFPKKFDAATERAERASSTITTKPVH